MSVPNTAPQELKVNVDRRTGITVFQVTKARMEWTAQNHVRVVDFTPNGEQVVCDVAPNEITKARLWPGFGPTNGGSLDFHTLSAKIRIDPSTMILSPEPGESAEQFDQRLRSTPIPPPQWWIDQLKAYGVDAKGYSLLTFLGIGFGGGLALVIVILVLALLFS